MQKQTVGGIIIIVWKKNSNFISVSHLAISIVILFQNFLFYSSIILSLPNAHNIHYIHSKFVNITLSIFFCCLFSWGVEILHREYSSFTSIVILYSIVVYMNFFLIRFSLSLLEYSLFAVMIYYFFIFYYYYSLWTFRILVKQRFLFILVVVLVEFFIFYR